MKTSGLPGSNVDVVDVSQILANTINGKICVQGVTLMGEPNKPRYTTSWPDFVSAFGSFHPSDLFPLLCKRALDGGAKLYVSRVAHYDDIEDKTTISGVKASASLSVSAVAETRATSTTTISAAGVANNTIKIKINTGTNIITLGSYTVQNGNTTADVAAALRTAIGSNTYGFSVSGSTTAVIITAPVGSGANANNYVVIVEVTGTVAGSATVFSGGVTVIPSGNAGTVAITGKFIGAGYNGTKITISAAKSGTSGKVDIKVEKTGTDTQTFLDVTQAIGETEKGVLNQKLKLIDIGAVTTQLPIGSISLSSGSQDITLLTDIDYMGSQITNTGWYAFDSITDAFRIFNFSRPTPSVDVALAQYCIARGDMRFHTRTPVGLNDLGIIDYRMGTGSYSHTPIDTWLGNLEAGDINVTDPQDTEKNFVITALADIAGLMATKDPQFGEWFSAAGGQRGKIVNNNGVPYNLGSPALAAKGDVVYEKGINLVINHSSFGPVYWGNRSLLRDTTKLTSKANVADLALLIKRSLKPLVEIEAFNPNDPIMWSLIYRRVRPFILTLQTGRAIWPESDSTYGWKWQGDQNADKLSDVVYNNANDILAGKYKALFAFVPITATEYINIVAAVSDNTVSITIQ